MKILLGIIVLIALQSTVWAAEPFTSRTKRQVSEIEKDLVKAQGYYNASPKDISGTKHYLGNAEDKLSNLLKNGQRYKDHPEILSLQERINILIQQANNPVAVSTPAVVKTVLPDKKAVDKPLVQPVASKKAEQQVTVKPLSSGAKYKLKEIKANFDRIKRLIDQNAFDHVKKEFVEFDLNYSQLLKTYGIPANHPELASFTADLNAVKKDLAERTASVDALSDELKPFVESISDTKLKLELAFKAMTPFTKNSAFYDLTMTKIGFNEPKDKISKIIAEYMQALYKNNSQINKLIPIAQRQTNNFFEQFPTPEKIKAILLTDKPYKVAQDLKKISYNDWQSLKETSTKMWIDALAKKMNEADAKVSKAFANKSDHLFINQTVEYVDYWILNIYGPLLGIVKTMYPEPYGNDNIPPLTSSQKKMLQTAEALQKDLRLYRNIIAKLSKDSAAEIARAAKERLDNERFPKGKELSGAEKNTVNKIVKSYFGTDILRLVIDEDWELQTEILFKRKQAIIKTYNYLTLWVAYKTKQNKYEYTHVSVRRARTGSGDWGAIKFSGIGHQWTRELRQENLYK